ncbi:DUF2931 family protein [Elizabethkingia anophelis]|uniref:DUF2931 family protein n=3 Tax=Elizabethkingia anophelis TaxID=1117645 RepID=UPI000465DCE3|nr:DUF2931 family protein [Elizabethkingia anophelis]OPC54759.1 hypothetical protein BAY08_05910 [Elizabethkingia anophelis]
MKKNLKTHLIKGLYISLNWLLMISLGSLLLSCSKTKYEWEPGISAPKYYPVGGVRVDFGNAGHGSLTNFDNGWGDQYGALSSGERYKEIPKEVFIHYSSCAENYTYQGTVHLPQDKLKALFQKYDPKKDSYVKLVVGMATGGWIRVWFTTLHQQIEVAKARLKRDSGGVYNIRRMAKCQSLLPSGQI